MGRKPDGRLKAFEDQFWPKVLVTEDCWLWLGAEIGNGYGTMRIGRVSDGTARNILAHRAAYLFYRGEIPDGLEIDHLCRVRHCVNPFHLEPVTHKENYWRGVRARKAERCAS